MDRLKVMISSTIEDLKPEREIVEKAIRDFRFERFRSEAMGSLSRSPSEICDEMAKECDIYILIIGKRYGWIVPDVGLSVTEREYQVARESNPGKVLVFVQDVGTGDRELKARQFLERVTDFALGYFRAKPFKTPSELYEQVKESLSVHISDSIRQAHLSPINLKKIPTPGIRRSKPPDFSGMDEYEFQDMCSDLFEAEPKIATCEVYGTRGEQQHGIDLLATRKSNKGIEVGQCKCKNVFWPNDFVEVTKKFFEHWKNTWAKKDVKRFILFVACDISPHRAQDAKITEQRKFQRKRIKYEVWSNRTIRNKLRFHRSIVQTYLSDYWANTICEPASTQTPPVSGNVQHLSVLVDSVLTEKVESLTQSYSKEIESKLEEMRNELRKGDQVKVFKWLAEIKKDPSSWNSILPEVRAKILSFESIIEINEKDNLPQAKELYKKAQDTLSTYVNPRLEAMIKYKEAGPLEALRIVEGLIDTDSMNLRAAFLLELGRVREAEAVLDSLSKGMDTNG